MVDLTNYSSIVLAVDAGPAEPSNVGFGSIVLLVAVAVLMAWMAYLWLNARRTVRTDDPAPNVSPPISDDELEGPKLTRILMAAVVSSAVLAGVMSVYYATESRRQANAAEKIHEKDVEEGEKWFEFFSCVNCHGPAGVGGGREYTEPRSGLDTSWAAPSLNDVFYRFSEDEITELIVYGREGTPMPANGLEGGGAMTKQEVEQVIAYIRSVQISQGEVLDEVEGVVEAALSRIANGEETINNRLDAKRAELEDIEAAPDKFDAIADLDEEIRLLLRSDGTCTEASANLVGHSCDEPGTDTDRDGLTDQAEFELENNAVTMFETLTQRQAGTLSIVDDPAFEAEFDRSDAFTNLDAEGHPIPDLERADSLLTSLDGADLTLSVIAERIDLFRDAVLADIAYLEEALSARKWEVDRAAIADAAGVSITQTERAVGLFNGYCARCHTAGYSAGVAFELEAGSGAWGPSLLDGRAVIQFPEAADQIDFVVNGSEFGKNYGLNGLGSGRMPAFGQILSAEDIELIVKFERSL
jgi:mono/diheme cytochrome c family protein